MNFFNKIIVLIVVIQIHFTSSAQTTQQAAVELWATVQSSPPTVTLNWVGMPGATSYVISKKLKTSNTWTTLASGLSGSLTSFVDNSVTVGANYEYGVMRTAPTLSYNAYGYINTGIEVPAIEYRGKLILLIETTYSTSLASEITRLQDDLEGDGWTVITDYVAPTTSVTTVKGIITGYYNQDPLNTKALFLLGKIPVPYSGSFGPDAHTDHQGAWPADTYYGDMDGVWTDNTVNVTSGLPARTQNVPFDGKFDQNTVSTGVELQVGRVDLSNMPTFTLSTLQLMKNYLDKDHNYRKKVFTPIKRAVVDDNFGYFNGEAFASSGYKNFGPLVHPSNVSAGDYFTSMQNGTSYLWSYGCGGGSFTSASGIGNTANFASSNLGGVFTILFGSYFGDWDIANNFLRAPLCQGTTLTNFWSGRPHWVAHHMGLGETIGYSTRVTQNNTSLYYFSYAQNFIGISLMGDPTLRNDVVAPVSNVVATKMGNHGVINWTASTQTNVIGYNIYMRNDTNTTYVKVNNTPITATSYTNLCLMYPGIYKYMVKAVVLETTPSGTYYNLSEGISDTLLNTTNLNIYGSAGAAYSTTSSVVNFTSNASAATSYFWSFGDGTSSMFQNPNHTYSISTAYVATVTISNACSSNNYTVAVSITTGLSEIESSNEIFIYPNPTRGDLIVDLRHETEVGILIYTIDGKLVHAEELIQKETRLNLAHLSKGIYFIKVSDKQQNTTYFKKLIIE
ncbi:MAG: T9SS type A sorting domain-containing protein [Bacteroidota bacterium]